MPVMPSIMPNSNLWASNKRNFQNVGTVRATYDFTVDGGAISTITPQNNNWLPNKAILVGGVIDIVTTLVGGGASIAVGTSTGSSTTSIKGVTAVGSWTAGLLAVVPVFTAATMVKLTAGPALITVTVSGGALTAGRFTVTLYYIVGD